MKAELIALLKRRRSATLAKWWDTLNCWGACKELEICEDETHGGVSYSKAVRGEAMNEIIKELGWRYTKKLLKP